MLVEDGDAWFAPQDVSHTAWRPLKMWHASIATSVDPYGHLDLSDVTRDLALVEKSIHSKAGNHAG